MEFRMLGPVELWSDGLRCDLGSARARGVLAILMLTPGTIVPTEVLIDRIWDTDPPAKARETLTVYITRLRSALRRAVGEDVRLTGRSHGYVLEVDTEAVDLHRFRRLRRQADALAGNGDADHAAQLLREADQLWRGEAFAGITGDWMARMRDSLDEERRAAILKRVECDLELGRHADLVGELQQLRAQYPLDEVLIAHQMSALYGTGRAGEALSLYREARSELIEEHGTEPGPVLAGLHQRILNQDPDLSARRQDSQPPPPDTVPPQPAQFVGREEELQELARPPGDTPRISVIEGMAGVGKTALAVQAAHAISAAYPDGVYYLNLHAHDPESPSIDATEALHRLLRMFTAPTTQIPDGTGQRAALLRAQMARKRAIVILDDAAQPDQVRPLLPLTGQSLVLITTRRALPGLAGASVLGLDVLPSGDALTLFRQVAGRELDEDEAAAAVELCGRLPLAIQLTAGRLAQRYPPRIADLVEELSQSPARLDGTGVVSPEVMSAFDLSYRSLDPAHQRLFRALGTNPCPDVSLHAAAALGGGTLAETEAALGGLLDHHLLTRAPAGRFRFHDLIREYAAARAATEDPRSDQRQAVGRLLDFYLHTADRADRVLSPLRRRRPVPVTYPPSASPAVATQDDAASWLASEWRNILQAAQYAARHEWKDKCADLVQELAGFLEIMAYWDEAITAHTLALQAARDLDDPARIARAALELSAVSQQTGRIEEAGLPLAEEALALYRSLADQRGEAEALDQISIAHTRAGRSREALAYAEEAGILYRNAADPDGLANTLSHSGLAAYHLGRYPEAMDQLREALSLYGDVGDRRGQAKTLNNLGRMQLQLGFHRDALDCYEKSLAMFRAIGGTQNEAILYHNIGSVYQYKGSYDEGLAAFRRALAMYRRIGDLHDEADVLNDIGATYYSAERFDEALIYHQKARLIAEEIGNLPHHAVALRGLARVHHGCGRFSEAADHYQAALRLAKDIGDPYEEAKILDGLAETTLSARRPDDARILLRQALDIFRRLGVPEAEMTQVRIDALELASPAASVPALRPGAAPPVPIGASRPAIGPAGEESGLM
jgi:DNA-binding SARP family transcriptional activator/Tfp pilus assembly protein PilF